MNMVLMTVWDSEKKIKVDREGDFLVLNSQFGLSWLKRNRIMMLQGSN